jgi:hypothetical protein
MADQRDRLVVLGDQRLDQGLDPPELVGELEPELLGPRRRRARAEQVRRADCVSRSELFGELPPLPTGHPATVENDDRLHATVYTAHRPYR